MAKSGLVRTALGWLLDQGAEKVYQDDVADTAWKKIKAALPAIFGSGAVTSLLAWFTQNWIPAVSGGVLGFVLLIYATALIRVLRIRRADATAITGAVQASTERTVAGGQGEATKPDGIVQIAGGTRGPREIGSLGVIKFFSISMTGDAYSPRMLCTCCVVFYGFPYSKPSPFELRLTALGTNVELCRLELSGEGNEEFPGMVLYQGYCEWNHMRGAVESTMGKYPQKPNTSSPWRTTPPSEVLFCDLVISLPFGTAKMQHASSTSALEFEVLGRDEFPFRAWIQPWDTLGNRPTSMTTL